MNFLSFARFFAFIGLPALIALRSNAQKISTTCLDNFPTKSRFVYTDSTGQSFLIILGTCKNNGIIELENSGNLAVDNLKSGISAATSKTNLIKVHGNILYTFNYRSYMDTPFLDNDITQHLIQTNLDLLIRDKYPLRITITNRTSNSNYFKDATDITINYNRQQLIENIKYRLSSFIRSRVDFSEVKRLDNLVKESKGKVEILNNWLSDPARVQAMVEDKERSLRQTVKAKISDSIIKNNASAIFATDRETDPVQILSAFSKRIVKNKFSGQNEAFVFDSTLGGKLSKFKKNVDSLENEDTSITEKVDTYTKKLEAERKSLLDYEMKLRSCKKNINDSIKDLSRQLNNLNSPSKLYAFLKENNINKDSFSISKTERFLLAVNKIGIGRSNVDYSELTVKNISLTGVNIEMNPSPYYLAFAVGKINYRYRDFIFKTKGGMPNQNLTLMRGGIGNINGNNLIFTIYGGRKDVLMNGSSSQSLSRSQDVLGLSLETKYYISPNTYLLGEVAKSSNEIIRNSKSKLGTALDLRERGNEAFSLKLRGELPKSETKFSAYYRKMGAYFQSFNLYPTGNEQEAFMARVTQSLLNKKVTIDASIRKNDFNNPFVQGNFSNTTIFKSIQITARIPKYPFVSVGYYPTSQLSIIGNNQIIENQYNTLNATVFHNYKVLGTNMNSGFLYTQFFNKSIDTGFIYYNTSSYSITHTAFWKNLSLQGQVSCINQEDLKLLTIEPSVNYFYRNKISCNASLKWSRRDRIENLFGGSVGVGFNIKKIGLIQVEYDKSWLPGFNRELIPLEIGRLNFYREF